MRAIIVLAFAVSATPALAQSARTPAQDTRVWTAAPTAGYDHDYGAPADRAGVTTGPENGVLFSASPTGAVSDSGGNSPESEEEASRFGGGVPNLGK